MRDTLEALRWFAKNYPNQCLMASLVLVLALGALIWATHELLLGCPGGHSILVYVCTASAHGTTTCTPEWHTVKGCS